MLASVLSVRAQAAKPAAPPETSGSPSATDSVVDASEATTLLFVPARTSEGAAKRDALQVSLLDTLRDSLTASGRYRVLTFSPTQPVIKRALLEHTISIADMIEPVKPETLQRLARAIGARSILTFGAGLDSSSLDVSATLQEVAGQQDWQTRFTDQFRIETRLGKRRLNRSEMVNFAVDAILTRMGLASHLADNLREAERARQMEKLDKAEAGDKSKKGGRNGAASASVPSPNAQQDTLTALGQTGVTLPNPNRTPAPQAAKPDRKKGQPASASASSRAGAIPPAVGANPPIPIGADNPAVLPNAVPLDPQPAVTPLTPKSSPGIGKAAGGKRATANASNPTRANDADSFAPFTTDTAPGRAALPVTSNTAPPSNFAPTDHEASALKFRQSGDLANVILSLRRAINERPRDLGLRRALIQAYQERRMPDAALAEAQRAQQMSPEDSGLQKQIGDTLLAKGDVTGALKAYREAARLDPGDAGAQVALADALLADSQFAEALAGYEAAAKTDPKSPLPHRRLARALANRAAADPAQYAASLEQTKLARGLTPATDTDTYLDDYLALMRLMDSRLRDIVDELQNTFQAAVKGKRVGAELARSASDMKLRAEAAADYLDRLPAAVAQEKTHAQYQQGAALALQAISLFRDYLGKGDSSQEDALRGAIADARRELTAGAKRLDAARPAPDTIRPGDLASPAH